MIMQLKYWLCSVAGDDSSIGQQLRVFDFLDDELENYMVSDWLHFAMNLVFQKRKKHKALTLETSLLSHHNIEYFLAQQLESFSL